MQWRVPLCIASAIAALICGCQTAPTPHGASSPPSSVVDQKTPEALSSLNKLFLDSYRARQLVVKSNASPVIFANFDSVILFWNGTTETNRVIPAIYHSLKAVAHVPFGIFLRLEGCARETHYAEPEDAMARLKIYQSGIAEAEAALEQAGFSPAQLSRQREIMGKSKRYLAGVINTGRAPREELLDFTHGVGPLLLANANDAAVAQLKMTHAAVMQWKRRIPAEDWKRLMVVVSGPQMPRRLNLFTQYFAKALGENGNHLGYPLEGRRLIYAEQIFGGRDPVDLMATTMVDGDASEAFFGDRWRMSRDILADGAKEYLRGIKIE